MQPVALDRHRHVVGIDRTGTSKLEIGGDLDAQSRRRAEGYETGGRVDRPARGLLDASRYTCTVPVTGLVLVRTSITLPDG